MKNPSVEGSVVARILASLADHAEDICLAVGSVLIGVGCGIAFGYPYGLLAFGVLCVAYGVWITERRH